MAAEAEELHRRPLDGNHKTCLTQAGLLMEGLGNDLQRESLSLEERRCLFRVAAESRVKGQIDNAHPRIAADLEII
jgi:hypothetical protein